MGIKRTLLLLFLGAFSFASGAEQHNEKVQWQKLFDVKSLNAKYIPQAIEVYESYVLFSVHAEDAKSVLIVFEKQSNSLEYLFEVDMPAEATHTSDFCIAGERLLAIDYASNKIYTIELLALLKERKLIIDEGFYLGMGRTGSLAVVSYEGEEYVLFSQFLISSKLKAFKLSLVQSAEVLRKEDIAFTIDAHRFIQGLYTKYNMLLMATNNFGVDTITIADIPKMLATKSVSKAEVKSINAPFKMVEDIAILGNSIITSDEESNYIYISEDLTQNGEYN